MRVEESIPGQELVPKLEPIAERRVRYGAMNLLVMIAQVLGWIVLLTVLDHPEIHLAFRIVSVLFFCLLLQGVFSLMHEYCHYNAHQNRKLNYLIGWVSATLFGTIPTLVRVQHWGHHRRNRTEPERGEFIHAGEKAWVKFFRYYSAILGGLWLVCFLFPIIAVFLPYSVARWMTSDEEFNTYSAAFHDFKPRDWTHMRLESLLFYGFWIGLLGWGPWSWETLLIAYGAFAFTWSNLQWVFHINTPIHVIEGAYNLRAPGLVRLGMLNFNYNLTHHRKPHIPWQELYKRSNQSETQPLWYRYMLVFRPPVPFPEDTRTLEKQYF